MGALSPYGITPREIETTKQGYRKYIEYLRQSGTNEQPFESIKNLFLTQLPKDRSKKLAQIGDNGTARALQQAKELMRQSGGEPKLLFLNIMDVHDPHYYHSGLDDDKYDLDTNWDSDRLDAETVLQKSGSIDEDLEEFRKYYRANMDYVDRKLGKFIEDIKTMSKRETTFLITSDHGENLGGISDERMFGHTSSLSEGLLHVPFEVVNPSNNWPEVVEGLTSHLSLPKILENIAKSKDDIPKNMSENIVAEVVGNTPPVFEGNMSRWDRAIRAQYYPDQGKKIVWDSLNNIDSFDLEYSQANYQSKADIQPEKPELNTWEIWGDQIINMKRENMDLNTISKTEDGTVLSRLESLGYA